MTARPVSLTALKWAHAVVVLAVVLTWEELLRVIPLLLLVDGC